MAGVLVLAGLLAVVPLEPVRLSIESLGARGILPLVLPPMWLTLDALAAWILVRGRVPLRRLFALQVVSDGIGQAVPAMGLAGEPWRIGALRDHLAFSDACGAVVRLRLVHAASGLLHAAWTLALASAWLPGASAGPVALGVAAGGCAGLGLVLTLGCLTRMPGGITALLLRALRTPLPEAADGAGAEGLTRGPTLPEERRRIAGALACKLLMRALQMLEIALILFLLGVPVTACRVITMSALVALSGALFVVVPQGLGVSEAGATAAAVMLGLPPAVGLSVGLLRRGRIVAWTLIGLALGLAGGAWRLAPARRIRAGSGPSAAPPGWIPVGPGPSAPPFGGSRPAHPSRGNPPRP